MHQAKRLEPALDLPAVTMTMRWGWKFQAQSSSLSKGHMAEFIYLIHPFRDGYFEKPTKIEETVMEEHYQYLRKAAEEGTVLLAGPCLDDTFGLVIFRAESDEAARVFMFNDPSVLNNVMMAELHPMRASVRGQ